MARVVPAIALADGTSSADPLEIVVRIVAAGESSATHRVGNESIKVEVAGDATVGDLKAALRQKQSRALQKVSRILTR